MDKGIRANDHDNLMILSHSSGLTEDVVYFDSFAAPVDCKVQVSHVCKISSLHGHSLRVLQQWGHA